MEASPPFWKAEDLATRVAARKYLFLVNPFGILSFLHQRSFITKILIETVIELRIA
jgi:hypothetical protein